MFKRLKYDNSFDLLKYIRNFCEQQTERGIEMIKKKYTEEQEKLARFAKAMGHPARIAILDRKAHV